MADPYLEFFIDNDHDDFADVPTTETLSELKDALVDPWDPLKDMEFSTAELKKTYNYDREKLQNVASAAWVFYRTVQSNNEESFGKNIVFGYVFVKRTPTGLSTLVKEGTVTEEFAC